MKFGIVLIESISVCTVAIAGHLKTAITYCTSLCLSTFLSELAKAYDAVDAFCFIGVCLLGKSFNREVGRQFATIRHNDCTFHSCEINRAFADACIEMPGVAFSEISHCYLQV